MKKEYIVMFFFLVCFKLSLCQRNIRIVQEKTNPYEMVHCGDSVINKLYSFIRKERGDSVNAGIWIRHILMEDKANNYQFVEGIYRFKLMGPTTRFYYFIYTLKDGVQIIKDYSVENLLTEVMQYFKRNKASLNEKKELDYLGIIIENLKNRDVDGDYEILKMKSPTH
ncbi:MAG: hypothetical protein Q8908_11380 [Bacteroidota bacterium]|nr:hypothetical protein [Bacteroidota bacterium]